MSRYADEDEDEITTTPARPTSTLADDDPPAGDARKVIKRGWGQAEQTKNADSPFAQTLKVIDQPQLIKFLEDDPYTSFRQHWVERQGQKSFVCIAEMDPRGCPLCDVGHRASARFAFNVALMTVDNEPVLKSYEVGNRIIDSLKNFHIDPRQGPLPKNYWAVSKTGTKATTQVNHQMVRERDLVDEWGTEPITEDQLARLRKISYNASIVTIPSRKTILALVAEENLT